jgi:4-amino-4-deoxy-L-arabinose transferase-like glycosyltransferase
MKENIRNILILLVLCYVFFIFGNSIVSLTNPDEVFYTQTAKEMAERQSWMTPYLFGHPQFEKPIFLYWLMRIGFFIFGINSFSARFFPALFGIIGVIAVYLLCVIGFKDKKKAMLSSLILMSSGLYIGLARTVFTDMIFSVFILLSLLSFFWAYSRENRKGLGIILFFVFSACAVLSKGPLGIFIPAIVVFIFLALRKDLNFKLGAYFFWGFVIFILISLPWYILMIKKYGNAFTDEFFVNDHLRRLIEAEHLSADTWFFYPASMLAGMFPWSLYVLAALFFLFKDARRKPEAIYTFLISWIAVVFLIFQPAHSKLASYIFPMFPALAIVSGDFFCDAAVSGKRVRTLFIVSSITLILVAFFTVSLVVGLFAFPKYISEYLTSKNPVFIMAFLFLALSIVLFVLIRRREFFKSAYCLMCFIPVIFSVVPLIAKDIEPYLSPKDTCEYLLKNHKVDGAIVGSKFFVRGIRYYSGKDVAAMNPYAKDFFSPHPIPFLDTDKEVADFLRKQPVTYCIFKKTSLEDIKRQEKEFNIQMLKQIGNEYVVRVTPKARGRNE